jgi:hypothetical protein
VRSQVLDFVALCAGSSLAGGAERFNERRRLVCISGGLWYLMSLTLLSQVRVHVHMRAHMRVHMRVRVRVCARLEPASGRSPLLVAGA